MRTSLIASLFALLLPALGCSGGDDGRSEDAGSDAPRTPVQLAADPDPAELTTCSPAPPPAGQARAKHVSCADELVPGSVAMGQVGDILLDNARARFIIRTGTESACMIGAYSGGVLDAAPHGGADLIKELFAIMDLSAARPEAIVVTDAGGDGDARVRVLFQSAPIGLLVAAAPGVARAIRGRGAIDYELRADEDVLRVTLSMTTQEGVAGASGRPGFVALMGGAGELLHPGGQVLTGDGTPGGDGMSLLVSEGDDSAVAIRALPGTGSVGQIESVLFINGAERGVLTEGELFTFEARVGVGHTEAEAWNAVHLEDTTAELTLEGSAGDRIEVAAPTGEPIVRTRLDDAGHGVVRLPVGSYRVRAGFGPYFDGAGQDLSLTAAGTTLSPLAAPRGTIRVEATADGDATAPVRVTVDAAGIEVARWVAFGSGERALPPGDYRVTVSRGMEHTAHQENVTVAAGGSVTVTAALDRVVDTAGWVAGDFHLHSEMSTDSLHAVVDALQIIAAEGLEVVASTDHDYINDYPGLLEGAGVGAWLLAVPGVEMSSIVYGHMGGYPLVPDRDRAGNGAPVWFDTTPTQMFAMIRERGDMALGGAIVQINHPRDGSTSFFSAVNIDRETGHATASPADLGLPGDTDLDDFDFDVAEVFNGSFGSEDEDAFQDWLSLMVAGRRVGLVANSDSHTPRRPAGSPRTFLRVADDSIGGFAWPEVGAALREGRSTFAGGIFVTAEAGGPAVSDVLPLNVRVQAAPWVSADRLRVYAGRTVALDIPLTAPTSDVIRLYDVLDVPLGGADFVVVRVDGDTDASPVIPFRPYAFTSPVAVP